MKKLIITASIVLTSLVTFGQSVIKVTKSFPCHDQHSNVAIAKRKTIDSLTKQGYVLQGLRVEQTVAKKGYNTQVLTFVKAVK